MVGAISGRLLFSDTTHSCPCLCLDSNISSTKFNFKTCGELGLYRKFMARRELKINSSFLESWCQWRSCAKMVSWTENGCLRRSHKLKKLTVFSGLGGSEAENDDPYDDMKNEIINLITYKAVRTVLYQLYEMNKPQHMWFHNFIAANVPNTGKGFLHALFKERRELAERVMITRLHLYSLWMNKCDHSELYNRISDQNVELMRERLTQTVIWPSEDEEIAGSMD